MQTDPSKPAFGEAVLTNCELEQIHLAGSIQPHGALLVISEPGHEVVQESENAAEMLGTAGSLLGSRLSTLDAGLAATVDACADETIQDIPVALRCRLESRDTSVDVLVHRPYAGGLVVEIEPAGSPVELTRELATALQRVSHLSSLRTLCDETARTLKELTGYDRVMIYRFDDAGHGEVFAEEREPELEAFYGNRYPASDIPQIARRLYERNRVRTLVDVSYSPVRLSPRISPVTGQELDMSMCYLRSMSPIHIQYLKNMGVAATFVVSLMVGGRLWGLIACHHYSPRVIHYELRTVCDLLAEAVGVRIAALEGFERARTRMAVRRLEQAMLKSIVHVGDWRSALFEDPDTLFEPLDASGVALLLDGEIQTAGDVPGSQELRLIANWLDCHPRQQVVATAELSADIPDLEPSPAASGMLAAPLSRSPGDYLIWFRPEQVRTVIWGGNPTKPVVVGDDPLDLSPRRSFSQWRQLVEGKSRTWTAQDLEFGQQLMLSLADVILQFRSVRALLAKHQLDQVSEHVRRSAQPIIIADANGHILLVNESFDDLLRAGHRHLQRLDDLPRLFAEPGRMRQRLVDLQAHGKDWRGEVKFRDARSVPMLARAETVLSKREHVLGYVLMFTDLSEQRTADEARRRFNEAVLDRNRATRRRTQSKRDDTFSRLLPAIVQNAELAALEITEGVDEAMVPDMLDSFESSLSRAAMLIEHLSAHSHGEQ